MYLKMDCRLANRSTSTMERIALASFLSVLAISLLSPSISSAQEEKKVKTFDFSGDDIDGELVKPDGEFVDPRQFASHTNLIRIRKDFIKEIVKSAEDL